MDRTRTVHHTCNGQPHSQEQSRNSHDQKSPTILFFFFFYFSVCIPLVRLYTRTDIRNKQPGITHNGRSNTVLWCVQSDIQVLIPHKFLAGNGYHWHLQNTGLSPHVTAMWVWADHKKISKAPISLAWRRNRAYRVPYCYSIQHRAYKI